MDQSRRNWKKPEYKNSNGTEGCSHKKAETIKWHQTSPSPREGREALGHIVVIARKTTRCLECPYVGTETIQLIQPNASDLEHHLKGPVPARVLRYLDVINKRESANGPDSKSVDYRKHRNLVEFGNKEETESPCNKNTSSEENDPEVLEEEELGNVSESESHSLVFAAESNDMPISIIPSSTKEEPIKETAPTEKKRRPGRPKKLYNADILVEKASPPAVEKSAVEESAVEESIHSYWKNLPNAKRILKALEDPTSREFPYTSPNSMFVALMHDTHEITGEHSTKHLHSLLTRFGGVITTDQEEIENFSSILFNIGGKWTSVACRLAAEWGVIRQECDDSWIAYNTAMAEILFKIWLKIPPEEIYPPNMRDSIAGKPSDAIQPTRETQDLLSKAKELNTAVRKSIHEAVQADKQLETSHKEAPKVLSKKTAPCATDSASASASDSENFNHPLVGVKPTEEKTIVISGTSIQLINPTRGTLWVKPILSQGVITLTIGFNS